MSPLDDALTGLSAAGLNLAAVLPRTTALDVAPKLAEHPEVASVLLLGSGGRAMWPHVEPTVDAQEHPVDEHALAALQAAMATLAPLSPTLLWPGDGTLPVTRLGEIAGWSHPSPLGLGIHPTYGLWFAYRGVIGLGVEVAARVSASTSPCASCVDRPCIAACPAGVLSVGAPPRVRDCFVQRLRPGGCEASCAARRACPVGAEHQYPPAQEAHHHRAGLRSYLQWVGDPRVDPAPPPPEEWRGTEETE